MKLLELYLQLGGGMGLGWALGRTLPTNWIDALGKGLYWVGVPVSIFTFLRQADLSGGVWLAAAVAWGAIFLGILALKLLWWQKLPASRPMTGSLILSALFGNTGYLGYPVALSLVGSQFFGWALFYDLAGTTLGAYGLGVAIAARYGSDQANLSQVTKAIFINPALWSFAIGLMLRPVQFPSSLETILHGMAWGALVLAVLLIGMRLGQLREIGNLRAVFSSLGIKMILIPLLLGGLLRLFGLTGSPLLAMVLQMAMPPAFASLVLAEAYDLDRKVAVTALAFGSIGFLLLLPLWLWLFGTGEGGMFLG